MKKRFLSLMIALAMMVGVFTPLIANAAEPGGTPKKEEKTESVTLHKILMDKDTFKAFTKGTTGKDGTQYVGEKITNVKDFFAGKQAGENAAKEIDGVFFAWQKQDGYKKDAQGILIDKDGKVIEAGKKEVSELSEKNKSKVVENWVYIDKQGNIATVQDPKAEGFKDAVLGGLTGSVTGQTGYKFETSKFDQSKPTTYKIVEIHSLSSYKGKNGETLTDMKAVPVEITLPLVNEKGVVKDAHVYPKNTEEKPQIDKNFDKEKNGEVNGITKDDLTTETKEKSLEINLDDNHAEKPTAVKSVGQSVPYKVVTKIPAQTKWATAKWDDKMTEGLTYNKDLSIELKMGQAKIDLVAPDTKDGTSTIANKTEKQPESDYTIKEENNGFVLEFTKTGLEKLNNKAETQTITLKYTAKVNDKSVVKVPESNDITFHYGNNPGHGNTPVPNKPSDNGELKATKTWADGKWAKNEKAKFKLVDANTGKDVTADDLVEPADASKKAEYEAYKKAFKNEQEIGYGATTEAIWKYLDKNREYKVVETSVTYEENGEIKTLTGWEAEYAAKGKGETTIKNYLTNNPTPLNPSEPKVVTYGAKFVKTNVEGKRLQGAEFVIKNADGNFLTGTKATRTEYEAAQKAFVDAVKAYNEKVANNQTPTDEEKAKVARLEKARDAAWNATLTDMTQWGEKDKALKLTSNELGQFEIAGLKDGSYTLVEVKAPTDYVDATKATLEFGFTIDKDGKVTSEHSIDFGIDDTDKKNDNAQQIINKKVTIPQTGGIGTIIFTAIGLAIMASAVIAIKKRQATEAR